MLSEDLGKYLQASSHASSSFLLNYSFSDALPLNLNSRLVAKLPTVVMADGSVVVCISGIGYKDVFQYRRHKAWELDFISGDHYIK